MAPAVDEERRGAGRRRSGRRSRRPRRRAGAPVRVQVVAEPLDVEAELARRSRRRSAGRSASWWSSSRSCISQNAPCAAAASAASAASWACGWTSVQRQVPPDVADVAEVGEQLAHDRLGLPAVGALEVAVLDHGDRGVGRAADVVAVRVDRRRPGRRSPRRCPSSARMPARRAGASRVTRNTSQVTAGRERPPRRGCRAWPPRAPGPRRRAWRSAARR